MQGQHPNIKHGMLFMLIGTAIVPVMDAIAKYLGDSMSPLQITWGRFLFQVLIMGSFVVMHRGPKALIPQKGYMHAVRGVLLAVATFCFFMSLRYLPLADAIAIFFVQPMILTLMSALFLGETIGWHRKLAVLSGFIGALFIIKPGTDAFTIAAFLPLATAVFFSTYMVLTRSVANIDHPTTMQFVSGSAALLLLTVALYIFHLLGITALSPTIPQASEWFWLAMIGLVAAVGHMLVIMGMNRAPASVLAPFGYVEIIAATALGWLIFGEWPDSLTWIGIVIIVLSGGYVFIREQRALGKDIR